MNDKTRRWLNESDQPGSQKKIALSQRNPTLRALGAKHLHNHAKMWFEYLVGRMRISNISKLSIVLFFLLGVLSSHRLFAAEDEPAPSTTTTEAPTETKTESTSEDDSAKQSFGIGKFSSLPFHVSASVRGGYDDNVNTASFNPQGSTFINLNLAATYAFGSARTAVNLQTNGGITQYFDEPGGTQYDFNPNITFSITHKATPRLTLALTTYAALQNQPDFVNNAGLNRRSGSFFYTSNKFSAAYRWKPRFSTVTSYTLATIWYDDSAAGSFENRFEQTFGNEFRFLVWPTTTVVGDLRYGIITYDTAPRDSISYFLLGGFDHNFSPRFNISTRAGVEIRTYENFEDRMDPYFEGTLSYSLGPHMTLSWNNRYSIEEPDVLGSPGRTTFRSGLTGSYKITARITATLAAYYQHDANDGTISFFFISPPFAEDSITLSLAARYAINHTWGAELGYDFTDVESDIPFRGYNRSRFYGGVNFTF